jgi:hypothetical protein
MVPASMCVGEGGGGGGGLHRAGWEVEQILPSSWILQHPKAKTVSARVQYLKDQRNYLVKIAFWGVARSMKTAVQELAECMQQ